MPLQTQNQDEQQLIAQREAQLERDQRPATEDEQERERRRQRAERQMLPDKLSIGVQPYHFADTDFLPGFSVDDARKLKGGEGAQFRTDAVKMVEVETARIAQLKTLVGTEDIHLAVGGVVQETADWAPCDAALAKAQQQVIVGEDEGDSDVKEIAIVSACLMVTASYQPVAGAEAVIDPPPEDPPVQRQDETDDTFGERMTKWRLWKARQVQSALPADPPIGTTAEPQWKQG